MVVHYLTRTELYKKKSAASRVYRSDPELKFPPTAVVVNIAAQICEVEEIGEWLRHEIVRDVAVGFEGGRVQRLVLELNMV